MTPTQQLTGWAVLDKSYWETRVYNLPLTRFWMCCWQRQPITQALNTSVVLKGGAPSPNTVRGVLRSSLELQQLERQVNQALWVHLNTRCWKGLQKVAVDLVEVPYHGLAAKNLDEIRRGQAKQGTTHFNLAAFIIRQNVQTQFTKSYS